VYVWCIFGVFSGDDRHSLLWLAVFL